MKNMKLSEEKFEEGLSKHKQKIALLGKLTKEELVLNENAHLVITAKRQARELSLALSGFKCEKCSTKERLSYHHLILRRAKYYMDFKRYVSARNYWGNLVILCWKCHKEYHDVIDHGPDEEETEISEKDIKRVKDKYYA